MSKVFLALQDVDEARPVIEAIRKDNPAAVFDEQPAMIRITAEDRLVINRQTVCDLADDPDWVPQDIQLVLISFGGNLDEDDDHFTIYWNK